MVMKSDTRIVLYVSELDLYTYTRVINQLLVKQGVPIKGKPSVAAELLRISLGRVLKECASGQHDLLQEVVDSIAAKRAKAHPQATEFLRGLLASKGELEP